MALVLLILLSGLIMTALTILVWKKPWRWVVLIPPALLAAYCVKIGVDFRWVLFLLMMLSGLIGPLVTALAIALWEGRWRWVALIPPALFAAYCVKIGVDFSQDVTSHNLLPFELLYVYSFATPYYAIIAAIRWLMKRSRPLQPAG